MIYVQLLLVLVVGIMDPLSEVFSGIGLHDCDYIPFVATSVATLFSGPCLNIAAVCTASAYRILRGRECTYEHLSL